MHVRMYTKEWWSLSVSKMNNSYLIMIPLIQHSHSWASKLLEKNTIAHTQRLIILLNCIKYKEEYFNQYKIAIAMADINCLPAGCKLQRCCPIFALVLWRMHYGSWPNNTILTLATQWENEKNIYYPTPTARTFRLASSDKTSITASAKASTSSNGTKRPELFCKTSAA